MVVAPRDNERETRDAPLPEDHVIGMLLVVGKAVTPARPKGGFIEKSQMVIENHF